MNDRIKIDPTSLPTLRDLHRATFGIALMTTLLTIVAVLPAEYGVDPTGIGARLGLTALGELKHADTADAGSEEAAKPESPPVATFRTDEFTLTLAPNEGTEVKAAMAGEAQLIYSWTVQGGRVFYDFHGEPKGAPSDVFTSFEKGTAASAKGEFEAPFEGVHGWYWKNVGKQPVTIQLRTSGLYTSIARLQ